MKLLSFGIAASLFAATGCEKDEKEAKLNLSELPISVQPHLSSYCSEGCKAYIKLVEYSGQQYYFLGLQTEVCDPDPNNLWTEYYDIAGNPIDNDSQLANELRIKAQPTDKVWNCVP